MILRLAQTNIRLFREQRRSQSVRRRLRALLCKVASMTTGLPTTAFMKNEYTTGNWLERLFGADPDVVRHAVKVTVWGRWLVLLVVLFQLVYRPRFWFPDDMEHLFLHGMLLVVNGLVHHRLLTNRPVTWRWLLALSAMDISLVAGHAVIRGGFDNYTFLGFYPALGAFAAVFTSLWLVLAWTTTAAVIYSLVSVMAGPGLNLDAGDEKVLMVRLAVMYFIAVGVSLIIRFDRARRRTAMDRERQAHQERIELSQSIHDTTAQTAYMIGLGIEGAMKLAGDSNPALTDRLAATADLTRSAMWELRRPIDMGRIFEGRELARVLGGHTTTFARITSIPAEMVQSGQEPPLSAEVRAGLFSIAHNALANAFLHAQAARVEVRLDFEAQCIRLSVSDDGVGLPEDYAERGRGFSGMEADAERMSGRLIVESGEQRRGTTITCVVPSERAGGGS